MSEQNRCNLFDELPVETSTLLQLNGVMQPITDWSVSLCQAKEYPNFSPAESVDSFEAISDRNPTFSGFLRYEADFTSNGDPCVLQIEDAYESVEVWCNGVYCGRRFVPEYLFDLSAAVGDQLSSCGSCHNAGEKDKYHARSRCSVSFNKWPNCNTADLLNRPSECDLYKKRINAIGLKDKIN